MWITEEQRNSLRAADVVMHLFVAAFVVLFVAMLIDLWAMPVALPHTWRYLAAGALGGESVVSLGFGAWAWTAKRNIRRERRDGK